MQISSLENGVDLLDVRTDFAASCDGAQTTGEEVSSFNPFFFEQALMTMPVKITIGIQLCLIYLHLKRIAILPLYEVLLWCSFR